MKTPTQLLYPDLKDENVKWVQKGASSYIYIWVARPEEAPSWVVYIFISIVTIACRLPANEPGATLLGACPRNLCYCIPKFFLAGYVNTAAVAVFWTLGGVNTSIFI